MPKLNYVCIRRNLYHGIEFKPGEMISSYSHPGDCFMVIDENDYERYERAQSHPQPRRWDMWGALKG